MFKKMLQNFNSFSIPEMVLAGLIAVSLLYSGNSGEDTSNFSRFMELKLQLL